LNSKKINLLIMVVFVLSIILICTSLSFAAKKPEDVKISLIVKNFVNPYFIAMGDGAEAAAEKYGVVLEQYAPERPDDVEQQIRIVEDIIQRKDDGIVIVPVDSQGIVPGILKANQMGVPIVVADTRAEGGDYIAFVGVDSIGAAKLVADWGAKKLNGKGNVVILEGTPGSGTGIDKVFGFQWVVKQYPDMVLLDSQTAMFNRVKGMELMENYLTRFPKIDGVFACNDQMSLGAIEAIEASGRADEMIVVSINGEPDALQAIKDGKMDATLYLDPYGQSYAATELLIRNILYDEVSEEKVVFLDLSMNLITEDNVDEFINK